MYSCPFECSSQAEQLLQDVQEHSDSDFAGILLLGARFVKQCDVLKKCGRCEQAPQGLIALHLLLPEMLALLQEACYAYTSQDLPHQLIRSHLDGEESMPQGPPRPGWETTSHRQSPIQCQRSTMSWSGTELDDDACKILAKTLLLNRLMAIGSRLDELREMFDRSWRGKWAQQPELLQRCERSISSGMEKATILVGQLKGI
ncbi:hypothetical protein CERZMDRAFT_81861 [Cercospora zeae-maydis SCOH1-5]|uniref:Aflatoxin regulatory protein domain-containing protein n=1 Tax=Cercospora zeae-maydis SCOH1-5 TaxID=717836 RepID=A0A6A6FQI9_9PEZI|nr:hypothetical protein CERZMDRAFT_81861 [Cercospora zeae-maydis SCOH1-5]